MTVVYGTVCLDVVHVVPRLPTKGGYVEATADTRSLGGEAANTAVALALWGADVTLVSNPIGEGGDAQYLLAALSKRGIQDAVFAQGGGETPVCHILVTPDGERTMFGRGFAGMPDSSRPDLAPLSPGGWTTADMNHGSKACEALRLAHDAGRSVYALDFVEPDERLIPGSFWQSSTSWVGSPGDAEANAKWVEAWSEMQACNAVLTDGANGLHFGRPRRPPLHLPAIPTHGAIDSTGAGDVFRAGMLFGLEGGWPVSRCLLFAASAAALNCQGLGGIGGLQEEEAIHAHAKSCPKTAALYEAAE